MDCMNAATLLQGMPAAGGNAMQQLQQQAQLQQPPEDDPTISSHATSVDTNPLSTAGWVPSADCAPQLNRLVCRLSLRQLLSDILNTTSFEVDPPCHR